MNGHLDVVLAVRSDSFSGVERYICDVAGGLASRGWRIAVVGGDPARMRERLPHGVPHLAARSTVATAAALARHGRVRIVHAHMSAAEAAAVLTRPVTRSSVVATRHFAGHRGSRPVIRSALKVLSRGIDREIAISRFVSGSLDRPSTVLLNGVPTRTAAHPGGACTVVVMQRFEPEKDSATAINAWASSGLAAEGWRLVVAGRGSQRRELELLAEAVGAAPSVVFTGFVDLPEALISQASIFLATAVAEPFGLAVVEAMSWGVPVVASAGGAHPETIGDAGLLFPAGDVEACAHALRRLATDSALRLALGARAQERQRRLLDLESHLDGLEAIYGELTA